MSDVKILDLETGEETIRDYTQAELEQAAIDAENARLEAEAKEAALAKLAKLGLTTSDLEALGLV